MHRWILATLLILGAVLVGGVAYEAGLAQGIATTGQAVPAVAPYAYVHPFGFGFGFLGLLFPILFLFLIFGVVRAAFGPRHRGGPGPWREGPPGRIDGPRAMFEDWHRQAHGEGLSSSRGDPSASRGDPRRPGGEASSSTT